MLTNPPAKNAKNVGKIPNFTKTFPRNSFFEKTLKYGDVIE